MTFYIFREKLTDAVKMDRPAAVPENMKVKGKHAGCANSKPMEERSQAKHGKVVKFSLTYMQPVGTGICTMLPIPNSFSRLLRSANTHLDGGSRQQERRSPEGLQTASAHGQR